ALATGESITVAARTAIQERLDRVRRQRESRVETDLTDIIRRGRARVSVDRRTSEEILGYDDMGLPR
ncbi:MAG: type II toxin-antitoxin system VapB family antitoxin, partial [Nocardioides sp.]